MSSDSSEASPCIADLGAAELLSSTSATSDVKIGTPGYMAPKIILHQPSGLPSDIWSFGVIIFALLVGDVPFWHEDRRVRNSLICDRKIDFNVKLAHCSESLRDLVSHMLEKSPSARPTIQQVLDYPWMAGE